MPVVRQVAEGAEDLEAHERHREQGSGGEGTGPDASDTDREHHGGAGDEKESGQSRFDQRQAELAQGGAQEGAARRVELGTAAVGRAQELEGLHPAHRVDHVGVEGGVGAPVLLAAAAEGPVPQSRDEGHEQCEGARGDADGRVDREEDRHRHGRRDRGDDDLGEVPGDVRLEVLDAVDQERVLGSDPFRVDRERAARAVVVEDVAAQTSFHAAGHAVGDDFAGGGAERSQQQRRGQDRQRRDQRGEGQGGEDPAEHRRGGQCLCDGERAQEQTGGGAGGDAESAGAHQAHEGEIDHGGPLLTC